MTDILPDNHAVLSAVSIGGDVVSLVTVLGLVCAVAMVSIVAIVAIVFNRMFKGHIDKRGIVKVEVNPDNA